MCILLRITDSLKEFWQNHPALLAGISLLIGVGVALFDLSLWTATFFALYLVCLRKWAALSLLVLGGIYAHTSFTPPTTPLVCTARFSIATLQVHQTPFQKNLQYQGTLYLKNGRFPCKIVHPKKADRPSAARDYLVKGTLLAQEDFSFVFKAKQWQPIEGSWSLAELRFQAKDKVREFLANRLQKPKTASFLSALATGDGIDRQIAYEFGRLGIQHLLAISGFHFGVLMASLSFFLGFFLPPRWKWGALLVCMTLYFVFIGGTPAVQRAWIATTLFILGKLTKRRIISLNILGAALLIELLWNPLNAANLGFQFSFGSCFGILLLYRPILQGLSRFFPKRKAEAALTLSLPAQIVHLVNSSLKRSLSLTLAVNIAILPILFYHFGKFPLLSLLYNLFFPPLVGMALIGLIGAALFFCLSGSGVLFHWVGTFCDQLLDLAAYPPLFLDRAIYYKSFPYQGFGVYFFGLLLINLLNHAQQPQNHDHN